MPNAWHASVTVIDRTVGPSRHLPALSSTIFCEHLCDDLGLEALLVVNLLRRRLSSSSSFMRTISEAFIPPKLERYL